MSLRRAVNHMCRECIYDQNASGGWRQQVTICTSFDCPLYKVRPRSPDPIPERLLADYGLKISDFPSDCGFTLTSPRPRAEVADSGPKKDQTGLEMGAI